MAKQYLPAGSVVLLKKGTKRLMIYGIMQVDPKTGTEYDYLSCLYPEGYIDPERTYLFNEEDIDRVDFIGYVDNEQQQFRTKIRQFQDSNI